LLDFSSRASNTKFLLPFYQPYYWSVNKILNIFILKAGLFVLRWLNAVSGLLFLRAVANFIHPLSCSPICSLPSDVECSSLWNHCTSRQSRYLHPGVRYE